MTNSTKKLKAAFVTPWFGEGIPGGAEAEARRTAQNLAAAGVEVKVLTTTLPGLGADWDSEQLPAGEALECGLPVVRFPAVKRNATRFNALNGRVMAGERLSAAEERDFYANMVHSEALLDYLAAHPEEGPFFFIPYLFTTSVWGPLVHPEKSVIIPCLHDEGYARMASVKRAFETARAVVFHVPAERDLGAGLYDFTKTEPLVLGEGIDTGWSADGQRFREKYGFDGPFLLYAGRKDAGKNTPLLVQYFLRYLEDFNGADGLKLAMIGNLPAPVPAGKKDLVVDLGFVDLQDKYDAYAAADVFVQPSLMESFSIVIMESWLAGTPIMVHGGCAVTKEHAELSGGGLHFADYPHFAECLNLLLGDADLRERMAQAGRQYVLDNFSWPVVVDRFVKLIARLSEEPVPPARKREADKKARVVSPARPAGRAVHQMLPDFAYGDAIGYDVLAINKLLNGWGINSNIYAENVHPRLAGRALPPEEYAATAGPDDVLIFHFSTGHALAEKWLGFPGRKILRYHNITPAEFLREVNPRAAERCQWGREQLAAIAGQVELGIGVSAYNCRELAEAGCGNTAEVPILLDWEVLKTPPDPLVLNRFEGQRKHVLHVGRIAPNKKIEDILKTHYFLAKLLPGARLLLVGSDGAWAPYVGGLKDMVLDLGVPDVHFSGHVTTAALMGYYRVGDAYLSMSEHEGFCVPLVEAMHFGLPIVAYASSGIPGTLGEGGVLLQDKDPARAAQTLAGILQDDSLAASLAEAGRKRLAAFRPERVAETLKDTLTGKLGLELPR